jgi:hypothetical protein
MARLGQPHRGTQDIDTATPNERELPADVDIAADIAGTTGAGFSGTTVKVDSIDVGDIPILNIARAELPDDPLSRAFVVSHRWAFDTASDLTIRCSAQNGASANVTCGVATPAALVAMKLQSAPQRRPARIHKSANDYLDLMLLLSHLGLIPQIAAGLTNAPHNLGAWCAERVRLEFIADAARISARIHQGPTSTRVTPDELRLIGGRFLDELARHS